MSTVNDSTRFDKYIPLFSVQGDMRVRLYLSTLFDNMVSVRDQRVKTVAGTHPLKFVSGDKNIAATPITLQNSYFDLDLMNN